MDNIVFTMTGPANSGKDTVATMIADYVKTLDKKPFSLAYADYLKVLTARNFGYDATDKEGSRHILQEFGTQVRSIEEDFWVRTVWNTIDAFRTMFDVFIVTDVRYENERRPYPWRIGYPIINIYVKNDNFESKLGEEERNHESEYLANNPNLEKFHFVIDNSGTLEETYEAVKQLVDAVYSAKEEAQKSFEEVGEESEVLQD